MSDPNYAHEYWPRRKDGKCQSYISGGRNCGGQEGAIVHVRYTEAKRTSDVITIDLPRYETTVLAALLEEHLEKCGHNDIAAETVLKRVTAALSGMVR